MALCSFPLSQEQRAIPVLLRFPPSRFRPVRLIPAGRTGQGKSSVMAVRVLARGLRDERNHDDPSRIQNAQSCAPAVFGRDRTLSSLNREQEMTLAKQVAEGDLEAQQRLVEANLRLVVS